LGQKCAQQVDERRRAWGEAAIQGIRPKQKRLHGPTGRWRCVRGSGYGSNRKRPQRLRKRRGRSRKSHKPSKPVGHMGRRSNYRLRNLWPRKTVRASAKLAGGLRGACGQIGSRSLQAAHHVLY